MFDVELLVSMIDEMIWVALMMNLGVGNFKN
jgi:hypothetical protein